MRPVSPPYCAVIARRFAIKTEIGEFVDVAPAQPEAVEKG
jgi:hypothetical protein